MSQRLKIPKLSLVVLVGASGSGKSTFARQHFLPTEVLSSDYCRGLVSDDENNQAASKDAFEVLNYIASKRLARGLLTVIDATNVQAESRRPLVRLAKQHDCLPVAIVLNLPERVCHERNRLRPDRQFGTHVVKHQRSQLRGSLKTLKREGFRYVYELRSVEEIAAVEIERQPLWNDRTDELGPFDIIGDVHGCGDELELLLRQLGYQQEPLETVPWWGNSVYRHPAGRKAVFVGDLVDRGPRVLDVLRIARNMMLAGTGICVPGNHDIKLLRALSGQQVKITHGLAQSLNEVDLLPDEWREPFKKEAIEFIDSLVSHFMLDRGKLVVAHAGMKEAYQGRGSGRVRDFALYGETTGETDEYGLPVRCNWAAEYRGAAMVVYGHTPVPEPQWLNRTINIDTGCVFGGKLTALRYPEQELVSVPARQTYCQPSRPFLPDPTQAPLYSAQQREDSVLDLSDVTGKRVISTQLHREVTIREENATAALEVLSRYACDPKWMIYLPPTMSPCETSNEPGLLEHPSDAFAYYLGQGVSQVVCEEKHMGSRAIAIICRDEAAARDRFGVCGVTVGTIYTRTGRPFFNDHAMEAACLQRLQHALSQADFWNQFNTTWVCLDCELMPWSAKAQELLRGQYAAVGAAGRAALPVALERLGQAASRLQDEQAAALAKVQERMQRRNQSVQKFITAYRQYCWDVSSVDDLKLAPFHIMATEGKVHVNRDHRWHMEQIAGVCRFDLSFLQATNYRIVDLHDFDSMQQAIEWWQQLTESGGEGMVVKPLDWITRGPQGLVQPAVKCRGKEYLRIIYSADYDADENLPRLRQRGLGRKRSLALREFALGIEGLERFVRHEPLRRVHECAFGVLALESEPVDPRL